MTRPHGSVAARATDPVALAQALVRIPSVNPGLEPEGAGERAMADFCARLFDAWALDCRRYDAAPGRPNVVAELPGAGPTLLLNGHLDTVGVAGMTEDPFSGHVRDGTLRGRGACDMKGGLAAILTTARRLADAPMAERPHLVVALTSDEEHASVGMERLVQDGVDADFGIICEPTELTVMPAHKGFIWLRASFRGRAAHGSRPDLGVDAIRPAGRYLARLDRIEADLRAGPPHPLLGHGSLHAGTIRGGTAASVYPDHCELVIERRTLPGETTDEVVRPFRQALDTLGSEEDQAEAWLEVTLERPGSEVPTDEPRVLALLDAVRGSGREPSVRGMSAWVDAVFLNEAGVPTICFGPGSIEQAHTADEWAPVDEIRTCADALERFARGLAPDGTNG